jgi:hypothetical protein
VRSRWCCAAPPGARPAGVLPAFTAASSAFGRLRRLARLGERGVEIREAAFELAALGVEGGLLCLQLAIGIGARLLERLLVAVNLGERSASSVAFAAALGSGAGWLRAWTSAASASARRAFRRRDLQRLVDELLALGRVTVAAALLGELAECLLAGRRAG